MASTLLLNASLMVLVIVLFLAWRWTSKKDKPADQPPASNDPRPTLPAGSTTSRPADTQPASAPAAASQPADETNLSPFHIPLTENEQIAMGAVRDFIHRWDETGLYICLGYALRRKKMTPEEIEALPRADAAAILERPKLYRAQPMRIRVTAYYVRKCHAGSHKDLTATTRWPVGSVAWRIHALAMKAGSRERVPVVIYVTEDPTAALGEPDKVESDGGRLYFAPGRPLNLVGLFYKVYTDKEQGSGNLRDYPMFVAWQIVDKDALASSLGRTKMFFLFAGILVVLVIGFIMLKKQLRQMKQTAADQPRRYRPLRDLSQESGDKGDDESIVTPPAAEEDEDAEMGEIDPLLKQASEEYLRERQQREREQRNVEARHGPDSSG